ARPSGPPPAPTRFASRRAEVVAPGLGPEHPGRGRAAPAVSARPGGRRRGGVLARSAHGVWLRLCAKRVGRSAGASALVRRAGAARAMECSHSGGSLALNEDPAATAL